METLEKRLGWFLNIEPTLTSDKTKTQLFVRGFRYNSPLDFNKENLREQLFQDVFAVLINGHKNKLYVPNLSGFGKKHYAYAVDGIYNQIKNNEKPNKYNYDDYLFLVSDNIKAHLKDNIIHYPELKDDSMFPSNICNKYFAIYKKDVVRYCNVGLTEKDEMAMNGSRDYSISFDMGIKLKGNKHFMIEV